MRLSSGILFLTFAALSGAAAGCSRTYDGSVVPTYEVATAEVAGIPYLTLKPTPLDPPNMRGLEVPPPVGVSDTFDTSAPAQAPSAAPEPERLQASRRPPRRSLPAQTAEGKNLQCRDEAPGPRLVRMVCE